MTLEEAKRLKPGDRVLVEMLVCPSGDNGCIIDGDGEVLLMNGKRSFLLFNPEAIREKLEPTTRRKFKMGDIVSMANGIVKYVVSDEDDGEVLVEEFESEGSDGIYEEACGLTLVCAVENREDRKEGV